MSDLVRLHRRMRVRRSGIVLVACAAIALAAPLMAVPMSAAAAFFGRPGSGAAALVCP